MTVRESDLAQVNLPMRPFLFTIDQIATLIGVQEVSLRKDQNNIYLHFEGRSIGFASSNKMKAVNIAGPNDPPEWRVSDKEFTRWLKRKGFRVVERGYAK